jgi:molecular chaperone GrpE
MKPSGTSREAKGISRKKVRIPVRVNENNEQVTNEDLKEDNLREETTETPEADEAAEAGTVETVTGDVEAAESETETSDGSEEGGHDSAVRLKKDLEKKDAELLEMKDRYLRTMAEYENFRKRTDKEKADIYQYAVKDVMTKILPVLDNIERGITALSEEDRENPVAKGIEQIAKQFEKTLEDIGVKPIEAVGAEFDPNLHNAVMHVDDEAAGDNVVVEEFQKGYTYQETVVRHSMVKVAN